MEGAGTMRAKCCFAFFACLVLASPALADGEYLLVSSYWSHKVARFDAQTGAYVDDLIAADSGGLVLAEGLALGPDGNLYVGSVGYPTPHAVKRYNVDTGGYVDDFAAGGGLASPRGLTFGPDGHLYVCSDYSHEVLRYNGATGDFIDAFVPAGTAGMENPEDLIFRGDYLYVSNHGTDTVLRFNANTGAFEDVFASHASMENPHGMAFGSDGNLYVVSSATDSVLRFDGGTGAYMSAFVPAGLGGLVEPDSILFGLDGDLYVTGYKSNAVHRYDGTTGSFEGLFASVSDPTHLLIVPEPATLSLLALGALAFFRRKE